MTDAEKIEKAVTWLLAADGLLITAGAGMGVDSGLPDFRGRDGFWRTYPGLQAAELSFIDMANPLRFDEDPALAWGFYGHRLLLYRNTAPHDGFQILRKWADRLPRGAFVFTSNVDGQFQRAGFPEDRIHECHGTIHRLQCSNACDGRTWAADKFVPQVDEATSRLRKAVPTCPRCGKVARPNALLFDDGFWIEEPFETQQQRFRAWYSSVKLPIVIELGAGKAIPTVRRFSERYCRHRLIRINTIDAGTASQHGVGLAGSALALLQVIDGAFETKRSGA